MTNEQLKKCAPCTGLWDTIETGCFCRYDGDPETCEGPNDYKQFLNTKKIVYGAYGKSVAKDSINPILFPFQKDLTYWSLKKGRCAIFADTGLGKTFMQLEWARLIGENTLIVAPLSVARQTANEGKKINVTVNYARSQEQVKPGITITNYEMIEHFDPSFFGAVVLDESSILKSIDGKTKSKLIEMFAATPFKLCCTATPAPNDIAELANHAEFLGIMNRTDMLATFFVHDEKGWRLRGHAKDPFYRWLASWGMSIKRPSDLGYDDTRYILPELTITPIFVQSDYSPSDQLFFTGLKGITDRCNVRKDTIQDRVNKAVSLINNGNQYLVWCGMNEEARAIHELVPGSVNVEGKIKTEEKAMSLESFQDGTIQTLITKPKIAGFGMNFQNCNNQIFVGLSDSYEAYYQCIRRSWRFGQTKPVNVYIVLSEYEREIYQNVIRKEKEAQEMSDRLVEYVRQYEKAEIENVLSDYVYETDTVKTDEYTMMLGDSVERMKEIPDNSIDMSVFSPPFLSLYTYSPTERDIGNSRTEQEFFKHFNYISKELLRITKTGRNCCVHVSQVPAMLVRDGYIGIKDFRGKTIQHFEDIGWTYHGEVCIDKDPQAQAIRTHSKGLLFVQLKKDASWLRPALADYILIFRKPGENEKPIIPDLTNNEWIEFARPIWYGIRESDTLNVREARSEDDDRHIAPLQLGTIERCIRLWSNKGETIFSPFAGIGSEGYKAIDLDRKFIGIELKPNYYRVAINNLNKIVSEKQRIRLL